MPSKLLLLLNGTEVAAEDLDALIEVRAEEATDEADAVTIVATVDPTPSGDWPSLLDPLLTPRTPVVVQIARDDKGYRFDGFSAEAVWDLDAEGTSKLTVKAVDRSIELDAEEKVAAWPGQRDSAIAEAIFTQHGLQAEVTDTPPGPDPDVHTVLQRGSDWAFVRELATRWGYLAYLEAEPDLAGAGGLLGAIGGLLGGGGGGAAPGSVTGHFHPIDPLAEPQGELALGHGGDAYKAQVRVELVGAQRFSVTRLPPLAAAPRTAQSTGDDEAQGKTSLAGTVGTLLAPMDAAGEIEPAETGMGLARRSAYGVTLTATVDTETIGTVLRARRPILVRGLGSVLSGRYLVDKVRHVITLDAHTQEVTLKRNALGVTGDEPFGSGDLLGGLL